MAITLNGVNIEVAGYKSSGTATSGTATSLTDSSKAWTVNQFATVIGSAYIVWIISGTGAGATADIISNTSTSLTTSKFWRVNTSSKSIEQVTPNSTSVYAIAWNSQDCITALPGNCSWEGSTTKRTMICNKGILVKAGGAFADYGRNIRFTTADNFPQSEGGSLFQMGRLGTTKAGVDGGVMLQERISNLSWNNLVALGLFKLYGCTLRINKILDGLAPSAISEVRYNDAQTVGAVNGFHAVNSKFDGITITANPSDAYINIELIKARVQGQKIPAILEGVIYNEGAHAVSATSPGWSGGDSFSMKSYGTVEGSGWRWNRPIIMYNSVLPYSVGYFWNADFGQYTSLTDIVDWDGGDTGLTNYYGIAYHGFTVSMETKTSAGANLGTVAVGVTTTSNGTGQIITAKGNSAANHAPTKKRIVTTDANGAYTGPFGSGYGLFVLKSKITNSGLSRNTSTVVDYSPYTLTILKYGYTTQQQSRNWNATTGGAEVVYMSVNPYIVANESTARAYTGITMDGVSKTSSLTSAKTIQEAYDYGQVWRYDQAVNSDVIYDDWLTAVDGTVFILSTGWVLTPAGNLDYTGKRLSGGTLSLGDADKTLPPTTGAITLRFTSARTYQYSSGDFTGHLTLTNTSGGAVTVVLPPSATFTNSGPNITVDQTVYSTLTIQSNVSLIGAEVRIYDLDNSPAGSLGTEVSGTETCPTSTYSYVGIPSNLVWIQILKSGYREFGQEITIPSSDSLYLATLNVDNNQ